MVGVAGFLGIRRVREDEIEPRAGIREPVTLPSGSTSYLSSDAPPDGDMAAYLASLEKVRALRPGALAPAHGPLLTDPDAYLEHYITHRLARGHGVGPQT